MARIELIDNGVLFKEKEHEYWLGDKQLQGVTGMIQRQLFPNEYNDCPEFLIKRAGEYGKQVHKSIELLLTDFDNDGSVEVHDFIELTKGMNIERSEYNVTDGSDWSSNIDVVSRVSDTEFDLSDIKTYSGKLTRTQREKARWQLSIYSYLMEHQLKGAHVRNLYILHIRNKLKRDGITWDHQAEKITLDRIPSDICKALLDADLRGEQFKNPYDIPKSISSQIKHIINLIETKKKTDEELNAIKQNVMESMMLLQVSNWQTPDIRFTRTADSTRSSFDFKKFQQDHPDMDFSDYMKTSNVAGSLKIAV